MSKNGNRYSEEFKQQIVDPLNPPNPFGQSHTSLVK